MIVWIDAGRFAEATPVFSVDPLERHARTLRRLQQRPQRVLVSGPALPSHLPAGFKAVVEEGDTATRMRAVLEKAGSADVIFLDAGSVVDFRLLRYLAQDDPEPRAPRVALKPEGAAPAAVLRLNPSDRHLLPERAEEMAAVAAAVAEAAPSAVVEPDAVPSFITTLRRNLPFYLFTVRSEAEARQVERILFGWNYKGSTDFMTKWVYPPLVWPLVRFSTKAGISANAITLLSIVLAVAVVPLFAGGMLALGLLCAYAMSVLDSVDGKVARLTLSDSGIGNILDHGLDIVHPPFWYGAWAWGLGARDPADPLWIAAALLIAFYVGDRLVLMVAKSRFGRGLHAMHPIDAAARTWIARRNVNLVILTLGLLLGYPEPAFYVVCAWQGATMLWHAIRTSWLIGTRAEPVEAIK